MSSLLAVENREQEDPKKPASARRWIWPVAGIAAIVVFELTADLSLSAFVFCLRFGWSEFRTVCWIATHDPDRGRRRALCCFHAATGALKIVLGGIIVAIAIVTILYSLAQLQVANGHLHAAGTAILTAAGGLVVAALMTLAGLGAAFRSRHPLWIDRQLHRNASEEYPPRVFSQVNELSSVVSVLPFLTFLFVFGTLSILGADAIRGGRPDMLPVLIFFSAAVALLAAVFVGKRGNRICAQSPQECWPDFALDEP